MAIKHQLYDWSYDYITESHQKNSSGAAGLGGSVGGGNWVVVAVFMHCRGVMAGTTCCAGVASWGSVVSCTMWGVVGRQWQAVEGRGVEAGTSGGFTIIAIVLHVTTVTALHITVVIDLVVIIIKPNSGGDWTPSGGGIAAGLALKGVVADMHGTMSQRQ
ncbi:hypothetical protein EDB83DRAFT_2325893 [Lactarius deliciosus]|nr:hypothetical protein EDB83DRAFT_2325893 [Lactarius deliciosus]